MAAYSARPTESATRASSSGSIRASPAASGRSIPMLSSSGCSPRAPRLHGVVRVGVRAERAERDRM